MNYKEKYEAIVRRAKSAYGSGVYDDSTMEFLIPDLSESKDENIRKWLIEMIEEIRKANPTNAEHNGNCSEAIAYLEKQKEQKPVPKFCVGDYVKDANYKGEPLYQIVSIDKECYICEYRGNKEMGDRAVMHFTFDNPYLRLVPEPAEWSEEDVEVLETTIATIEKNIKKGSQITTRATPSGIINREDLIKKLKSLKNRGNSPKSNTNSPIEWNEKDEKTIDEAAEEYEKNKVHSISALGTDKDGFAYYMRTGTSFSDAFKAGAEWREQQIPKLPSNLDEAASKELQAYLPQGNGPDGICYFIAPQMLAMYKAGAEYMAGQGYTKEGEVLDRDEFIKFSDGTYIDLDPTLGLIPAFKLKDGDKVVVQIRKK